MEEHKEQIEVFHLSYYSPELNPDEYLNGNLKNKVHSGTPTAAHPDMGALMLPLLAELRERLPVIFDDICAEIKTDTTPVGISGVVRKR